MSQQIYDTTACKYYNMKNVLTSFERAKITDSDSFSGRLDPEPVSEDWEHLFYFITPKHDEIPQFNHPYIIHDDNKDSRSVSSSYILVDVRPYVLKSDAGIYSVKNRTDFNSLISRAMLTYNWIVGEKSDFLSSSDFHIKMFVNWVGSTVGRVRTLEPETQHTVNKIIALYYVNLFKSNEYNNSDLQLICSKKASVSLGMNYEELLALANDIDFDLLRSANGLAHYLSELSNTTLLANITVPVLFNYIATSWIGTTGKELSAISLEHPPTFMSLLEAAIKDRTMGKTQLGRVVHNLSRTSEQETFNKSLTFLKTP